jgi:hypothetical protein
MKIVGPPQAPARAQRFSGAMECSHAGFREITTHYDRHSRLLLYFWKCAGCGIVLREVHREQYEPQFDPRGNDRYLSALR